MWGVEEGVLENSEALEGRAMQVGWVGGTESQPCSLATTSLSNRIASFENINIHYPSLIVHPAFSLAG
ncbi:hypothetical protein SISSUDRAFT_1067517 [Sistotremastrum suecicum HHB10207 ss-3]|uniref:Uncharacterized protein n=1 Tax=Sistotremastrum suecicum HHB10207 ss-3 TaxID=1314776 RepID=A0A165X0Z0_9AGAM|nr:hypothetical protein SISSUDRAFT_1067517 [Sistotremastrum suecicum HHB10207 ss-3]